MGRIQIAYELKLRNLLRSLGVRKLDLGVARLVDRALSLPPSSAQQPTLAQVYRQTRDRTAPFLRRSGRRIGLVAQAAEVLFWCDAGLGGLARWLRAAGYRAFWRSVIDDDELLAESARTGAVLVTTDSMLMERRVLRDGEILSVWVPPAGRPSTQLEAVLEELSLPILPPRCMQCGGQLLPADKEQERHRIPPKTYLWLDTYFVCADCRQLFWHGTHWHRIRNHLEKLRSAI